MYENGIEQDAVDPRVHVELERLNSATDEINKLELELDEARNDFRVTLCEAKQKTECLRAKLGICVERARPYYEARFLANEALKQTQTTADKFEKANSSHRAAREMVFLAEQGLGGRTLDPAWQEMLNHATQRVNDAEKERTTTGAEHRFACIKHEAACVKVQTLQKELKRAISKSRPYYELKAQYNNLLEQHKAKIQNYESQVTAVKLTYADTLRNLERISDEIHNKRRNSTLHLTALSTPKRISVDSNESFLEDAQEFVQSQSNLVQDIEKCKSEGASPTTTSGNAKNSSTHSNEWIEINLDGDSSPEDEIFKQNSNSKPILTKQMTLPLPIGISNGGDLNEYSAKSKFDSKISHWISRNSNSSSSNNEMNQRRQSLENIFGPTGEKMKGMFSHYITNLVERRNSEPKLGITEELSRCTKKIPSPLEKTLTYLTADADDNSDTESLSSIDMLNEDQINSLMLDKEIENVCEQLLGTPINEIVNGATFNNSK